MAANLWGIVCAVRGFLALCPWPFEECFTFSQIFKLIVSTREKILDNIDTKTAHLRLSSVAQKRRLRKLPIILPSLTESATFMHARHDREGMLKPKKLWLRYKWYLHIWTSPSSKGFISVDLETAEYTVVKFQGICTWLPFNARMCQQPGKEHCFITKCVSTQSLWKKSTILLIIGLVRVQSNRGSRSITLIGQYQGATFEGFRMNRESFHLLLNLIRRELVVDGDGLWFPRSLNMQGLGKPG